MCFTSCFFFFSFFFFSPAGCRYYRLLIGADNLLVQAPKSADRRRGNRGSGCLSNQTNYHINTGVSSSHYSCVSSGTACKSHAFVERRPFPLIIENSTAVVHKEFCSLPDYDCPTLIRCSVASYCYRGMYSVYLEDSIS